MTPPTDGAARSPRPPGPGGSTPDPGPVAVSIPLHGGPAEHRDVLTEPGVTIIRVPAWGGSYVLSGAPPTVEPRFRWFAGDVQPTATDRVEHLHARPCGGWTTLPQWIRTVSRTGRRGLWHRQHGTCWFDTACGTRLRGDYETATVWPRPDADPDRMHRGCAYDPAMDAVLYDLAAATAALRRTPR